MKHRLKITSWHMLLIGVFLIALRFYPSIILNKVTVFGDNYSLQVPGKIFTGYWLKQGIIPWWNPMIFAGIPWAQEISQSVFYPSTLLFTYLDPGLALTLTIAFHLLFTYVGMYLFLRLWIKNEYVGLVGAILWAFSTQVTGASNNLVTLQSIAWFPWITYWGLRLFEGFRFQFIFSLFVLGQFLGGYPQYVVYAIVFAVIISGLTHFKKYCFFHWFIHWFVAGLLTLGVSAIAWVPFIELFTQSTRLLQTNVQAGAGSLNPIMLFKMFLPYIFDNPQLGIKWGPAWSGFPNSLFYISWFGLLVVVLSFKKLVTKNRILSLFIVISTIFSLGNHLPGFQFIQDAFPFFKYGRYPSMILILTNLSLIMLVTLGLKNRQLKTIFISTKWLIFGSFIVGGVLLFYMYLPSLINPLWNSANTLTHQKFSQSQFHTVARDYLILRNITFNVLINATLFMIGLLLLRARKYYLFVLIIGFDMLFNTQGMLLFAPADVYPTWTQIDQSIEMRSIEFKNPQYRTITRNMNEPYTDYGMYWEALTVRAPFSDSFIDATELESFTYLKQIRDSATPDWNMVYQIPTIHGYTTLLPQDFSLLWQQSDQAGINLIDRIDINNDLLRKWSVGNYVVNKQFVIHEDLPQTIATPLSQTVDLYTLPALPRFRFEDDTIVDISTLKDNPNKIELTIDNADHSWLIIADRFDPNWILRVNGEEKLVSNYQGMMQIPLIPGVNDIRLSFVPKNFIIGVVISACTFLFGMIVILVRSKNG